jgi:hypothetical protein
MNDCNVRSQLGCIHAMKQGGTTGYTISFSKKAAADLRVTIRHKK